MQGVVLWILALTALPIASLYPFIYFMVSYTIPHLVDLFQPLELSMLQSNGECI